eukprot:1514328-Prorocentrum_lima.AAC.1
MAGQNTTSLAVKDLTGEDITAEWHKYVQLMSKAVSLGQQVPAEPAIEHFPRSKCKRRQSTTTSAGSKHSKGQCTGNAPPPVLGDSSNAKAAPA